MKRTILISVCIIFLVVVYQSKSDIEMNFKAAVPVYSKNEKHAWNYFQSQGYSEEGIAAILGNLIHESKLNPRAGEVGSIDGGVGIAQWGKCGTASNGNFAGCRFKELEVYASNVQKDPYELNTQLEFIVYELETKYPSLNASLRKPTSVQILVAEFCKEYERPSYKHMHLADRTEYAQQVYKMHKK